MRLNIEYHSIAKPPHPSLAAMPLRATFSTGGEKAAVPTEKRLLPWVEKLSA